MATTEHLKDTKWVKVRNGCYVLVRTTDDKEIGNVHREVRGSNYAVWQAVDYTRANYPTTAANTLEDGKRYLEDNVIVHRKPFDPTGL